MPSHDSVSRSQRKVRGSASRGYCDHFLLMVSLRLVCFVVRDYISLAIILSVFFQIALELLDGKESLFRSFAWSSFKLSYQSNFPSRDLRPHLSGDREAVMDPLSVHSYRVGCSVLKCEGASVDENDESHISHQRNRTDRPVGVSIQVNRWVPDVIGDGSCWIITAVQHACHMN